MKKLRAPPTPTVRKRLLEWEAVEGASGYNVHCGSMYMCTVIGKLSHKVPFSEGGLYSVSAWQRPSDPSAATIHSPRSPFAISLDETPMINCPRPFPTTTKHGTEPAEITENYQLIFEDDFDRLPGELPDATKWTSSVPWGEDATINNEEQHYTNVLSGEPLRAPNPFEFDGNSNLIIRAGLNNAEQQADTGKRYYSGILTGRLSTPFKYGYAVTRMKVPEFAVGMWAAFWLLHRYYVGDPTVDPSQTIGANGKYQPELDWEMLRGLGGKFGGGPYDTDALPIALHYDDGQWRIDGNGFRGIGPTGGFTEPGESQQCDGTPITFNQGLPYARKEGVDFAEEFHDYAFWWEEGFVKWYCDGVLVASVCDPAIVPQVPMYPLLNLAVGGNFPGPAAPEDYVNGVELLIDRICIFQKRNTIPAA